jgi:hypothetical protein
MPVHAMPRVVPSSSLVLCVVRCGAVCVCVCGVLTLREQGTLPDTLGRLYKLERLDLSRLGSVHLHVTGLRALPVPLLPPRRPCCPWCVLDPLVLGLRCWSRVGIGGKSLLSRCPCACTQELDHGPTAPPAAVVQVPAVPAAEQQRPVRHLAQVCGPAHLPHLATDHGGTNPQSLCEAGSSA